MANTRQRQLTLKKAVEFCDSRGHGEVNGLVTKVNDEASEHRRVDLCRGL
jgi:hypothetical protein